jgi:hypothetical protein
MNQIVPQNWIQIGCNQVKFYLILNQPMTIFVLGMFSWQDFVIESFQAMVVLG